MTSENIQKVVEWLERRQTTFNDNKQLHLFAPLNCSNEYIRGMRHAYNLLLKEARVEVKYPF